MCPMDNPATERKIKSWGTAMQLDRGRREANRRREKEMKKKREKEKEKRAQGRGVAPVE